MTKTVHYTAMATKTARAYRAGAPDANAMPAERTVSDGGGNPCRHCLQFIPKGAVMLILAHRPFPAPQPYAESGPIFICGDDGPRGQGAGVPPIFKQLGEERLVKGYNADDRIVYGLGKIVPVDKVSARASMVLADPRVAYVHVRSATNNCFTCRIDPE